MLKFLFLLFFGYLLYNYILKPMFSGFVDQPRNQQFNQFQDMFYRMKQQQEQMKNQQQFYQQSDPQKSNSRKDSNEDYIDYEEVKD